MVSRCNPQTERSTLVFDIAGYSLLTGLDAGKFVRSAIFSVGGHYWCVRFYPNGDAEESKGYVSVYLELMSLTADASACYDLRLLNQTTGHSKIPFTSASPAWGIQKFKKRSELEASLYIKDDRLVIEYDITVVLGTPVSASETMCQIDVPPSDLPDDLGKLLDNEKRTDVAIKVEGEIFYAHKLVLSMRSPVFEAELYGPMRDKTRNITVEDMQPVVFKALLHFIYTDSLPVMDDPAGEPNTEMVKHLLVAADRYALERMKLMCESILCNRIDVENVASTLALAQYYCSNLKDACIGFINSSERVDDVMASKGYKHLKRVCPEVLIGIWEKTSKSRKH
ncbi:hypothetical protein PR202_ga31605 [Eleusine coracana subsp. coracana]|uniref:Uncharacterized protein n=1 Tax=Eleusine coracana subsp. coracana TaxID=191504 RepID=A0AAV5DSE4_ELECO|nr:hypothetical protein PR202_ga31605 [Eleusine coracana subsp. coracana]